MRKHPSSRWQRGTIFLHAFLTGLPKILRPTLRFPPHSPCMVMWHHMTGALSRVASRPSNKHCVQSKTSAVMLYNAMGSHWLYIEGGSPSFCPIESMRLWNHTLSLFCFADGMTLTQGMMGFLWVGITSGPFSGAVLLFHNPSVKIGFILLHWLHCLLVFCLITPGPFTTLHKC